MKLSVPATVVDLERERAPRSREISWWARELSIDQLAATVAVLNAETRVSRRQASDRPASATL